MTDAAKKAQREYLREWRKKNPEKNAQYINNYWERKAKQIEKQNTEGNA